MSRTFKVAVLMWMLVLAPLRALAAVTIDFCPGHQEAVQANAHHQHGSPHHDGHDNSKSVSAEHCASAGFAPPADRSPLISAQSEFCVVSSEPLHVDFLADRLDRPPLAL